MKVYFSYTARESLGKYYESYRYLPTGGTDLEQRSNKYREIVRTLGGINQYLSQTYIQNNKNYIEIAGIGVIEYRIYQAKSIVVIKDIGFNDSGVQPTQTNYTSNTKQRKVTPTNKVKYRFLKNSQYHHGFAIVRATNYRGLYNFVNQQKEKLSPLWFKTVENFKQLRNGTIAAKVTFENDPELRLLDTSGRTYKKNNKGKYVVERRRISSDNGFLMERIAKIVIENVHKKYNIPRSFIEQTLLKF